jgi:type VI secretion system protein ImpI
MVPRRRLSSRLGSGFEVSQPARGGPADGSGAFGDAPVDSESKHGHNSGIDAQIPEEVAAHMDVARPAPRGTTDPERGIPAEGHSPMALTLRVIRHNKAAVNPPIIARFGGDGGSIGRAPENDLCLPDPDRWVSSRHAKLRFREGHYYVVDVSTNGTLLNAADNRLVPGSEVRLANGDTLGICGYEIQVSIDNSPLPDKSRARAPGPADPATLGGPTIIERRPEASTMPPAKIPTPANRQPPPKPADLRDHQRGATSSPGAATGGHTQIISRAEMLQQPPVLTGEAQVGATPSTDNDLLDAFFEGLGCRIQTADPMEQRRTLRHAGQLLRTLSQGLIEVLKVRSDFKNELRLEMTTIQHSENNPFKFSLDLDETLERILREPEGSSRMLPPVEAAASASADLKDHQQAVIHGLRTLLRAVLQELDPDAIEQETPKSGAIEERLNPAARKARAWDHYVATFKQLHEEVREDALRRFDRGFADGYESYSQRRRTERGIIGKRRGRN